MLEILSVENVQQKREILQNLDSTSSCILVSDLRAKFEWQNHFLDKEQILSEEFIFRPSDLWKSLSRYLLPEYQIVSNDYILSYLASYLQTKEDKFLRSPSSAQNVFAYISQLCVMMEHPEGRDLLKEWFKENIDSFHRWGHWFFIAEELWEHFIEKKLVASSWVPALLLGQEEAMAKVWQRSLYLDLSMELKYVESELLAKMSEFIDIKVLVPQLIENKEYLSEFENYRPLFAKAENNFEAFFAKKSAVANAPTNTRTTGRFTSSLSEVKNAIALVREYLELGIPAQQIAIVACDIGEYWPVLRAYLDKEGVACQRPYNTGVQSLLSVSKWLSEMKLNSYRWQREDLESSLFTEENLILNYDEFQRFYSKVYGVEDLNRKQEVQNRFEKQLRKNEKLSRDDFVIWALTQWRSKSYPSVLENLIKQLISESPGSIQLYLKDWIEYIAKTAAKAEICIRPGDPEGILCLDIVSLDYVDCNHVVVLGMSESSFKKNSPLKAVSQADMLSLRAQTGFPLSPEESKSFEYYLLWNLYNQERSYYLSFSVTDFKGSISAPSLLWLKQRKSEQKETTAIDTPKEARLDSLQLQSVETLAKDLSFSEVALKRDFGHKSITPMQLERFSATGFREFSLCPFKFAAKYFYKLSSLPALDLDVDRMKNGNIIHKLFELAIKQKLASHEISKISNLVRELLLKEQNELGEKALIARYQKQYEDVLSRFLVFEEKWAKEFPDAEYLEQEYLIDVSWDSERKCFVKKSEDMPRFKAIIDRVDKSDSEYCVIDYKNSGASNQNFTQWFSEDDYQLLFYSKALRECFSTEEIQVMGAIYYTVKPMERTKGLVVKSANPKFLPTNDRKRSNKASEEDLLLAEEKLSDLINDFKQQVEEGDLNAFPKKAQETCGDCDWKTICRAKHLN